jgi:hypothetical protein
VRQSSVPHLDPLALSSRSADKLQAILNHDWNAAAIYLPRAYLEACASWFNSLTASELLVAKAADRFHTTGDETAALNAVGELPPAPKFPLSGDDG